MGKDREREKNGENSGVSNFLAVVAESPRPSVIPLSLSPPHQHSPTMTDTQQPLDPLSIRGRLALVTGASGGYVGGSQNTRLEF